MQHNVFVTVFAKFWFFFKTVFVALRSFILHGVQMGVSNCLSVLKADEGEIQNPKLLLNEWVLPWIAVSDTSA